MLRLALLVFSAFVFDLASARAQATGGDKPAEAAASADAPTAAAPAEATAAPTSTPAEAAPLPSSSHEVIAEPMSVGVVPVPAPIEMQAAPMPVVGADKRWQIGFDGYLRMQLGCVRPDGMCGITLGTSDDARLNPYVGRNDGFALGGARLNVRGYYSDLLYLRLGFDGSLTSYDDPNSAVGELATGLRDAYVRFAMHPKAQLFVGRFKPPFDVEELTATEDQLFVNRSLESRGVMRHEGFGGDAPGFAPGRQLGLMLASDAALAMGESMHLGYAAAVTNGNSGDATLNDNDTPAAWGRVFMRWNDRASASKSRTQDEEGPASHVLEGGALVGLSGFYNEVTTGVPPNRFRDRVVGGAFDAALQLSVFDLSGQLVFAQTSFMSRPGTSAVRSVGGHAQLGVNIPDTGFTPAYRFALYNPAWYAEGDEASGADYDRVMHHTVGVRYRCDKTPTVVHLEYTHSREQAGRTLPNDRVEAALQVNFE